MRLFLRFLCFISLVSFWQCSVGDLPEDTVGKFPAEFELDLFERLEPNKRILEFRFTSLTDFCDSTVITFENKRQSDLLNIKLDSIPVNPGCPGAGVPAQAIVPFSNLTNNTYDVDIVLRDALSTAGLLTVTADQYQLDLTRLEGIAQLRKVVKRIPDGLIWGEIRYSPHSSDIVDNLLGSLYSNTENQTLAPGYYSYFTCSSDQKIELSDPLTGFTERKTFVRNATNSVEEIINIVQNAATALNTKGQIRLYTWRGEVF